MDVGAGDVDGFFDFLDVFGADFGGEGVDFLQGSVAGQGDVRLLERLEKRGFGRALAGENTLDSMRPLV